MDRIPEFLDILDRIDDEYFDVYTPKHPEGNTKDRIFRIFNAIAYCEWGTAAKGANIGSFVIVPEMELLSLVRSSNLFSSDLSYGADRSFSSDIDVMHLTAAAAAYFTANNSKKSEFYDQISKYSCFCPGINFNLINLGLRATGHDKGLERALWFSLFGNTLQDRLIHGGKENPSQVRGEIVGFYALKDLVEMEGETSLKQFMESELTKHIPKVIGNAYKSNSYYQVGNALIRPVIGPFFPMIGEFLTNTSKEDMGKIGYKSLIICYALFGIAAIKYAYSMVK